MATRKGGLGRGLDALIPTSVIPQDITTPSGVVVADRNEIDINLISPNPKQPRTVFDEEQLAELAHNQWSDWMKYLFSKGEFNDDGTWTMPKWAVDRWTRQMNTKYENLSIDEKNSDKIEADKMLEIINQNK